MHSDRVFKSFNYRISDKYTSKNNEVHLIHLNKLPKINVDNEEALCQKITF